MNAYFKGKTFDVCEKGYLGNYQDYCDEWKEFAARSVRVWPLSKEQSQVIDIVRDYYIERGEAPLLRTISAASGLLPSDILKMFPRGLVTTIKIAGLPSDC